MLIPEVNVAISELIEGEFNPFCLNDSFASEYFCNILRRILDGIQPTLRYVPSKFGYVSMRL